MSLFMILLFIVLTLFGLKALARYWRDFQPSKRRVREDLARMKAELEPWLPDLVPLDRKELELLSVNQIQFTRKKRMGSKAKGIFTSIYHEPMIAWSYKRYLSPGQNALLYARTARHEFVFRITPKNTQVAIDADYVGQLMPDGRLLDSRGKKQLGRLGNPEKSGLLPIVIRERELGSLVPAQLQDTPNPRALEFVSKMEPEEEPLFLSLAILQMVDREVE